LISFKQDFSPETLQPVAHDLIYGDDENQLENLKNWHILKNLSDDVRPIVRDILQQKSFQDVYLEQTEKITKAKIPYKSKRQRQIEESALRKETEGATVRQVNKQYLSL
jgi:hypothetical protein